MTRYVIFLRDPMQDPKDYPVKVYANDKLDALLGIPYQNPGVEIRNCIQEDELMEMLETAPIVTRGVPCD